MHVTESIHKVAERVVKLVSMELPDNVIPAPAPAAHYGRCSATPVQFDPGRGGAPAGWGRNHGIHKVAERVVKLVSMELPDNVKLIRDYDPSLPELQLHVVRQLHRDQFHYPFGDLVDAFGNVHARMLWAGAARHSCSAKPCPTRR
jgi:hypothetical protein